MAFSSPCLGYVSLTPPRRAFSSATGSTVSVSPVTVRFLSTSRKSSRRTPRLLRPYASSEPKADTNAPPELNAKSKDEDILKKIASALMADLVPVKKISLNTNIFGRKKEKPKPEDTAKIRVPSKLKYMIFETTGEGMEIIEKSKGQVEQKLLKRGWREEEKNEEN